MALDCARSLLTLAALSRVIRTRLLSDKPPSGWPVAGERADISERRRRGARHELVAHAHEAGHRVLLELVVGPSGHRAGREWA